VSECRKKFRRFFAMIVMSKKVRRFFLVIVNSEKVGQLGENRGKIAVFWRAPRSSYEELARDAQPGREISDRRTLRITDVSNPTGITATRTSE